jgi:D-threo-aldose 1-dehydrogenase
MVDISLGTAGIGGLHRRIERDEAFRIFDAAWEKMGIRHYDTACLYGAGRAERLLGDWIAHRKIDKAKICVTTKIAYHLENPTEVRPFDPKGFAGGDRQNLILDYSFKGAMKQAEASLERLQLDRVDNMLLHDIDRQNHGARYEDLLSAAMQGTYRALQSIKEQGKASAIGLGVNNFETFADFYDAGNKIDCGVLAGRYTLLEQDALPLLQRAEEEKTRMFVAGNLNSGLLAGQPWYNYRKPSPEKLAQAYAIKAVCDKHGVPMAAAALQFSSAGPAVAQIVIGPNSLGELEENIEWIRMSIPSCLWTDLKARGILRKSAPVPDSRSSGLKNPARPPYCEPRLG